MTWHMILEGLIYSVVLALIVTVSQLFNPRLWLNCYPKAIQDMVRPRTKSEMRTKLVVGIPFMLIMLGYPLYSTYVLKAGMGSSYTYFIGLCNLMVIQNSFNLLDLIILDWLIFCTIKPRYLMLEGTEGMSEYRDYVFHLKAAGKGLLISVMFSAVAAAITLI